MATPQTPAVTKPSVLIPSEEAQKLIIEYTTRMLTEHKKFNDYQAKMEAIDVAYARYQSNRDSSTGVVSQQGIDAATTPVGVTNLPSTVPPVLVSQVDSMVAYLADVFLSGSPLFPIVSSPANRVEAETLESLIDDHATLGGYARQLLMFFKDGVKYNISAIEADWVSIDQYTLGDSLESITQKLSKTSTFFTKLKRWDPYNTVWDHNVSPGDIAQEGDYAGHIEILSRTKLKRLINRLSTEGEVINAREALKASPPTGAESFTNYRMHPQVSDYVSSRQPLDGINYYEYITGNKETSGRLTSGNYEVFTFYARIMPDEFKLKGTETRTPQIWKFRVVNGAIVIQAKRIISAYDFLPVLFGQPLEDGLGNQTQSIAEGSIPFQQAAATLVNIRFNSARRAVSDRALYDSDLIKSSDINAPVPAAKIPVKSNSLDSNKRISDAYHQIPFDSRGTETTIQDAMAIVGFGRELSGINNPMQGKFQKGNKSVQEWNDTMGGADARLRLPALTLEYQVFMPLKELIKLNIYQYGQDSITVSQRTGKEFEVKIAKLREKTLNFRVADGYTPKSKLAGTDSIMNLMQLLGQSQPLQATMGNMLPGMFAHLAQLMGVRGLEEYIPQPEQAQQNMNQSQALEQQKVDQQGMVAQAQAQAAVAQQPQG